MLACRGTLNPLASICRKRKSQLEQSYGRDDSTVEAGGVNKVNFNGRVTAGVIDRAGVDLSDSHAVCFGIKLAGEDIRGICRNWC